MVGSDPHFSYMKMIKASSYLERPGCLFVGTNRDGRLPTRGPVVIPGLLTVKLQCSSANVSCYQELGVL